MSTTIENIYQNALLADAAYVEFNRLGFVAGNNWQSADPDGIEIDNAAWDSDQGVSFKDRGFTQQQFEKFQSRYRSCV